MFSVSTTEVYTIIEDDMVFYDDGSDYQGEFISAQKRRWPKTGNEVHIPFTKKSMFASQEKEIALQKAIDEFETKTCIRYWNGTIIKYRPDYLRLALAQVSRFLCISRFVERNNEEDYLEIDLDSLFCRSAVGRKGGKQIVRAGGCLDDDNKIVFGSIVHELMHAAGRYTLY